jgi:hypothetical protein
MQFTGDLPGIARLRARVTPSDAGAVIGADTSAFGDERLYVGQRRTDV